MKDIKSRSVTFFISVSFVVAVLILSKQGWLSLLFLGALCAVVAVALWEFYKIAEHKGAHPQFVIGILASVVYLFSVYISQFYVFPIPLPLCVLGLTFFLIFVQNLLVNKAPINSVASSILGFLYVVVPLGYLLDINFSFSPQAPISGQWWLMYMLAVTKATDFGAYFVGILLGKTPLAPKISPKKTVEGLAGGVLCSIGLSILLVFFTPHVRAHLQHPWLISIITALVLSLIGQFGDLAESMFKRDANVKDSNRIKGSGGVLDMVDSIIFNTPIFYFFLAYGGMV